jgi:hypothetical protein
MSNYTCVLSLHLGFYAAAHIKEENDGSPARVTLIDRKLEQEQSTAAASAKGFANMQQIPFRHRLVQLQRPIFAIIPLGENWVVTRIYADKINVLPFDLKPLKLKPTQAVAINLANKCAAAARTDVVFPP